MTPIIFVRWGFTSVWMIFMAFTIVAGLIVVIFIHEPPKGAINFEVLQAQEAAQEAMRADAQADAQAAPLAQQGDAHETPVATSGTGTIGSGKPRYRELLTRDLILYQMGFFCFSFMLTSLMAYLPTVLQIQGIDPSVSGLAISVPTIISIFSVPISGMVLDRLPYIKPVLIAMVGSFALCLFTMYNSIGIPLWVAGVIMGAFSMGCVNYFMVGWARIMPRPELIPIAMGFVGMIQSIGATIGSYVTPLLLGPNLDHWVFTSWILLIVGACGVVCLLFARFK
jgi:cyanate permease